MPDPILISNNNIWKAYKCLYSLNLDNNLFIFKFFIAQFDSNVKAKC